MAIIATRIDGRLIHGQVANLWTPKLNITRIMVPDDSVAESAIEKEALKLARQAGVKLSVLPVEKAAANIKAGKYEGDRLLIVARRPENFLRLVELGVDIPELNVGNMSQSSETRSVTRSINVVDKDIADFDALVAKGVKLIAQMVPGDAPKDFMPLLDKVR